jgi:uncharacterized repeat protein (TIGR03803 family)
VLYGTTSYGGSSENGTVFSLAPPASPGGAWTKATLYNFNGTPDGSSPYYSGVVIGKKGTLYGTTLFGGTAGYGTVFELRPPASPGGVWTEVVLHSFAGGSDGELPYAGLAIGSGPGGYPVLYGTTTYGGTGPCTVNYPGCGTVFSLTPPASPSGAWTEAVLHNFTGTPTDGAMRKQA